MEEVKQPSWLWHPSKPAQIYVLTDAEYQQMLADGYSDTPIDVAPAAEAPKDDAPVELSQNEQSLLQSFLVNPEDLDKEQLIELAKSFDVRATRNMSEATIAKAIKDYLDGNNGA